MLSGAGKHFCTGLDVAALMADLVPPAAGTSGCDGCPGRRRYRFRSFLFVLQEAMTAFERCHVPVIAAVHGACIGAGVDMITGGLGCWAGLGLAAAAAAPCARSRQASFPLPSTPNRCRPCRHSRDPSLRHPAGHRRRFALCQGATLPLSPSPTSASAQARQQRPPRPPPSVLLWVPSRLGHAPVPSHAARPPRCAVRHTQEADLAIVADMGTLQRLPALVGHGVAAELALTARSISGEGGAGLRSSR